MATTKKTQQLKLKELLLLSDKDQELQEVEFQVKNAELQLAADILATKKSLGTKEEALTKAKRNLATGGTAQQIIDLQVEVEALSDGLKRLEALNTELF